ncbi:MAG: cadherin-like domain-containing protein, partial [Verrucomicrobiota bacterium]
MMINICTLTKPLAATGLILAFTLPSGFAQVTPGGNLGDTASFLDGTVTALTAAVGDGNDGTAVEHVWDSTTVVTDGSYELNPSTSDASEIALSAGRHLVLYNAEFAPNGGTQRAEVQSRLVLDSTVLAEGASSGFMRVTGGANEPITTGGAIITVASDDDVLQLQSFRSDTNGPRGVNTVANEVAIQLLKLDDAWDFLSASRTSDQGAVATNADVQYSDLSADSSLGSAFSFTAGSADITLNEPGLYMVFANTGLSTGSVNSRTQYSQVLELGGVPVTGTEVTAYMRGDANGEDVHDQIASIGTILNLASGGQILNVNVVKESGTNATIKGGNTAITIVKLPGTAELIELTDSSNQPVNNGAENSEAHPAMYFRTQDAISSSAFTHTAGTSTPANSQIEVANAGNFLFFGAVYHEGYTGDRVVPRHGWRINGGNMEPYGRGNRYNRNNDTNDDQAGSWSGAILNLAASDDVEFACGRSAAASAGSAVSQLRLVGISIESLIPSADPVIANNNPFPILQNTTDAVITNAFLSTVDGNTPTSALVYTIDTTPAGGSFELVGTGALGLGSTFTQDDIDNSLLEFDAGAAESVTGGFDFTVSDGGASPASGTFTVVIGEPTALVADVLSATNEDTSVDNIDPTTNDVGTSLTSTSFAPSDISNFNAISAQGATITQNLDGSLNYNPLTSASLRALDDGDSLVDSFDYTVTDYAGVNSTETISITVNGVNDAAVVEDEDVSITDRACIELNLIANDFDYESLDTLTLVSFDGNVVPGTFFSSSLGANVTVATDGSFSYDPATSATILALGDGLNTSETLSYEVSDGTVSTTGMITVTSTGVSGGSNDVVTVFADSTITFDAKTNDTIASGAVSTATVGAILEFDASNGSNTNASWINSGDDNSPTASIVVESGTIVSGGSISNAPPGIADVYSFSGGVVGTLGDSGAAFIDIGDNIAYPGSGIVLDENEAMLEFVFRPSDQVGKEVIFETGGTGTGSSVILADDLIIATISSGTNLVMQAIAKLPENAVAGGDFVHLLVNFNVDG